MSKDRELSVIDEILSALNKLDKTEDKQRAVEYVFRRVTAERVSNAMQEANKEYLASSGLGLLKTNRGLA